MVQHMAEPAGTNRDPSQLAIDGIEIGHQPAERQAECVMAVQEQDTGCQHQQEAEAGDHVGADVEARAQPHAVACRVWPQPFGDQVGDPLVGVAVQAIFELRAVFGGDRFQQRRLVAAQGAVEAAQGVRLDHGQTIGGRPALGKYRQQFLGLGGRRDDGGDPTVAWAAQGGIAALGHGGQGADLEQVVGAQQQHLGVGGQARWVFAPAQARDAVEHAVQPFARVQVPEVYRGLAQRVGVDDHRVVGLVGGGHWRDAGWLASHAVSANLPWPYLFGATISAPVRQAGRVRSNWQGRVRSNGSGRCRSPTSVATTPTAQYKSFCRPPSRVVARLVSPGPDVASVWRGCDARASRSVSARWIGWGRRQAIIRQRVPFGGGSWAVLGWRGPPVGPVLPDRGQAGLRDRACA